MMLEIQRSWDYHYWCQSPGWNIISDIEISGHFLMSKNDFLISEIIFTRGQFWPSGIVVACVSGPVQTKITKFRPKMHKTLVKVPIVLWTDRP